MNRMALFAILVANACAPQVPSNRPIHRRPLDSRGSFREVAGREAVQCGVVPFVSEDFAHRCAIALLNSQIPFIAEFRSPQTDVKTPVPFAFIGNSKRELRVVTLLADGRRHIELCAAPGLDVSISPPGIDDFSPNTERLICLDAQSLDRPVLTTQSMIHPHRLTPNCPSSGRRIFVVLTMSPRGEIEAIRALQRLTPDDQTRVDEAKQKLRFSPAFLFGRPVRVYFNTVLE
jgi:hypothetical protein